MRNVSWLLFQGQDFSIKTNSRYADGDGKTLSTLSLFAYYANPNNVYDSKQSSDVVLLGMLAACLSRLQSITTRYLPNQR